MQIAHAEPALAHAVQRFVSDADSFGDGLSYALAQHLSGAATEVAGLYEAFRAAITGSSLESAAAEDLLAVLDRDPSAKSELQIFLHYRGWLALEVHRLAALLWARGREHFAYFLQSRAAALFSVDIHPAAKIGRQVFIDHGFGVVIGETAVVGDRVSILQGVTLGGTGKVRGDRHPKIGNGVLLGAGAVVIGNITVGDNARIGASAVVIRSVSEDHTVVGAPARVLPAPRERPPGLTMDHLNGGLGEDFSI